jgi:hypothetical protein
MQLCIAQKVFQAPDLARLLEARFMRARVVQISRLWWRHLQRRALYPLEPRCKPFLQRQNLERLLEMLLRPDKMNKRHLYMREFLI